MLINFGVTYLRGSGARNTVTDYSVSGVSFFFINLSEDMIPQFVGNGEFDR